jgi:hypothetical protein
MARAPHGNPRLMGEHAPGADLTIRSRISDVQYGLSL